ncbi:hypothetical protein [Haloferula sargassicola]|uniref:DUF2269 family protein n=1 Tax=Haloferula sargassicola TaxID=490096 RepID=A0ABP9URU2_9BACT
MDPFVFRALHITAALAVFTALGAICMGGQKKAASILHGISLLVLLVIGFAMLGKPPAGQYWWVGKIVLWMVLGAAPAMTKRLPKGVVLAIVLICGLAAAWLGVVQPKPF